MRKRRTKQREKPVDLPEFRFGVTRGTLQRFSVESDAIEAAQIKANELDEPVSVYFRPALNNRPKLHRTVRPE